MCKYDPEETYMVNYVTHKYGTEFLNTTWGNTAACVKGVE